MAEDDLLARLNALKPSSVPSLSYSSTPEPDPEDELVNRFLRFRSLSPQAPDASLKGPAESDRTENGEASANDEDHKTLKELLSHVPPSSEWKVDADDERDIVRLLADAQKHIPAEGGDQGSKNDTTDDTVHTAHQGDEAAHEAEKVGDEILVGEVCCENS